jgi:hypothetical protein
MSQDSKRDDPQELINRAQKGNLISAESKQSIDVPDLRDQISDGLGVSTDDVTASRVVLVNLLVDDSSSIEHHDNEGVVRDGHNTVRKALLGAKSKQRDAVLMFATYLNGGVFYPYKPLDEKVPEMDESNYKPAGRTPLYDRSLAMLGTVATKTEEFAQKGVMARSISLIMTDGDNNDSVKGARDVKNLVDDLLAQERHIIAGMGIDDGVTDYEAVFADMGIPDKWILTPGNSESEIRDAFRVFSQSAVQASQGTATLSDDVGGFAG